MISYAILMLAMHPEYQERVFEEVKLIFPDKNIDNFVNYEDLNNLEFTERVIKETMRLFPAVPVMARNATAAFDLSKLQCHNFRWPINNFVAPSSAAPAVAPLPYRWHSDTGRKCNRCGHHIDSSGREAVGTKCQEV